MIQNYEPSRIRFSNFHLNLRTGELEKNGSPIPLQDKPARLLALLATHPGELVARSDIQKILWGDREFVDFEHAINTAIKKVREALGDDPQNPKLIETLPRKGYRFIGTVEKLFDTEIPEPAVAVTAAKPLPVVDHETAESGKEFALPRRLSRVLFLAIQVGCLAMYCAALYYVDGLEGALSAAGLVPTQVTLPLVVVTAMLGIAVRLFLLSSVGFGHPAAGAKFSQLFPALVVLDGFWTLAPLLVAGKIGLGVALAGAAGLAYLPFSQRTLMQSIYRQGTAF